MSITVVIPTYNRAHIIKKSIESVISQTKEPIEIIIVDDHSTDNTKDVIWSIKDSRIKYVLNSRTKGANGARNTGVLLARGKYIAFQDSDDYWLPEKLERQCELIENNPDIDMVFCSLNTVNSERRIVPNRKVESAEIKSQLKKNNFISTQTIFIKKDVVEKNLFDESLRRFQDWDFCYRIAKNYLIYHIDKPLVVAEIQNDSITRTQNGLETLRELFNKHPEFTTASIANRSLYNKTLYNFNWANKNIISSSINFTKYLYYKGLEKLFEKNNTL